MSWVDTIHRSFSHLCGQLSGCRTLNAEVMDALSILFHFFSSWRQIFLFILSIVLSPSVCILGSSSPTPPKNLFVSLQKMCFGAMFFKNVASGYCLSCVLQKRNSNTGHIAAFTKRGYRPALEPRFVMLRLRLAG